jgi:hypothetical protein
MIVATGCAAASNVRVPRMGLAGALAPYEGMTVEPGLLLDLHYERNQFEIGGSLRFSTPSTWASEASSVTTSPTFGFASASLGGRYFTSNRDFSPYLGGGLAYSYYRVALPSGFDGNASGLGVYVDAGIEVFRTAGCAEAAQQPLFRARFGRGQVHPSDGEKKRPRAPGITGAASVELYFAAYRLAAARSCRSSSAVRRGP